MTIINACSFTSKFFILWLVVYLKNIAKGDDLALATITRLTTRLSILLLLFLFTVVSEFQSLCMLDLFHEF